MKGLFITGTDTDVGKTHIACALARALSAESINVIPRKPVESGCKRQDQKLIPADALALKHAASYSGDLDLVCPYRFEPAISPNLAARLADTPLIIEQLKTACLNEINPDTDFLLVEGAGGFYSPLCSDGLNADLAQALGLPILLVAEDRLGCINQVLLSLEAIQTRGLTPVAVILSSVKKPDENSAMNNLEELQELIPISVIKQPHNIGTMDSNIGQQLVRQLVP